MTKKRKAIESNYKGMITRKAIPERRKEERRRRGEGLMTIRYIIGVGAEILSHRVSLDTHNRDISRNLAEYIGYFRSQLQTSIGSGF